MSVAAVAWAFDQDLPPNEKIVLLALADCENGQSLACMPSQEHIAEKSSMSVRSVQRMLVKLEERGLIQRQKRNRPEGRTSDFYVLGLRDNLSGGVEPTRQNRGAHTTTVSGTREPEGTGSNTPPTPPQIDERFDEIWGRWPQKSAKKAARLAWARVCKSRSEDEISEIRHLLVSHGDAFRRNTPPQFIPMLATFLNGERWTDPYAVPRDRGGRDPEPQRPGKVVIPPGHVAVWENGYIVGSRPAS